MAHRAPRCTSHYGADGLRLGLHEEGSHRVIDLETLPAALAGDERRPQRALREALAAAAGLGARTCSDVDLAEAPDGGQLVASLETDLDPPAAAALGRARRRRARAHRPRRRGRRGTRARRFMPLRGEPVDRRHRAGHPPARARAVLLPGQPLPAGRPRGRGDGPDPGRRHRARPLRRRGPVRAAAGGAGGAGAGRRDRRRRGRRRASATSSGPASPTSASSAATSRPRCAGWTRRADERVVLDPPRAGAGAEVVRADRRAAPAVHRLRLLRPADAGPRPEGLRGRGLRCRDAVELFDLFPDTFHLETVVAFRRA